MWPLLLLGGLFAIGKTSSCDEGVFGIDSISGYDVFDWDNTVGLWGSDCPSRYPKRAQVTSTVTYGGGVEDPSNKPLDGGFTFGSVLDEVFGRSAPGQKPNWTPVLLAGGLALGAIWLTGRNNRR